MEFDFTKSCRLSIDLPQMTSLRGHPQAISFMYGHTDKRRDTYSALILPVHTMSHIDLPWMPQGLVGASNFNLNPRVFRAIILDFTSRQNKLSPFLVEDVTDLLAEKYSELDLRIINNGEHLWRIVQELAISSSEIFSALQKVKTNTDLAETFVLMRTDWSYKFNKFNTSFNNPSLEILSAFLCHPFMTRESLTELISGGLDYFGHDLSSFENPLYFADSVDIHPFVKQAREYARIEDTQFEERIFDNLFLKLASLPEDGEIPRYYLKNLNLKPTDECYLELAGKSRSPGQALVGNLLVVPIAPLRDSLGIACEVYFQPTLD